MRDSHNQLNVIMLENVAADEESQDHVANTLKRGRQVIVPPDCETEDSASEEHDENISTEAPYNDLKMIGMVETDTLSISDKSVTQIKVQDNDFSKNMPSGFKTSATNANDNWNQQMTDGTALVVEGLKFTDTVDDDKDQKSSWGSFEAKQKLDEGNQLSRKTSEKITLQHLFSLGELDTLAHHMVLTSYGSISSTIQSIGQTNIEQVTLEEECSEKLQCDSSMTYESIMILENLNDDLSNGNLEMKCSAATNDPFDVTFSNQNGDSMEKPPNAQLEGVCNSGPKVSSGHIAYSGSISLRSESSTTSTHSFAFPM
ncbi:hypothetical protein B296_00033391 [Ensete ventricosum]|uniref:Uncharacterized protein n=1 Tax=Ensete ventricosum TaxID=4639 RepID=A0A426ZBP8_ENSVE|nr:hypothetical protein B296_00033391 [Ensete ventricosum]